MNKKRFITNAPLVKDWVWEKPKQETGKGSQEDFSKSGGRTSKLHQTQTGGCNVDQRTEETDRKVGQRQGEDSETRTTASGGAGEDKQCGGGAGDREQEITQNGGGDGKADEWLWRRERTAEREARSGGGQEPGIIQSGGSLAASGGPAAETGGTGEGHIWQRQFSKHRD